MPKQLGVPVTRLTTSIVIWCALAGASRAQFRPPAVPLVTCDPMFSIWSMTDRLTDDATRHWTGAIQSLNSIVRIDGKAYRVMGVDPRQLRIHGQEPAPVPPLAQRRVRVLPTRTIYEFEGAGVRLTLTFLTPFLPYDLDVLSRPVTYLTWEIQSTDGGAHSVSLYFDAASEIVVNTPDQPVEWARLKLGEFTALRMGSRTQAILERYGDDARIDWGYLYTVVPAQKGVSEIAGDRLAARAEFLRSGHLPDSDDFTLHHPERYNKPVVAYSLDLGSVGAAPVARHLVLAYDDIFSIEFFQRRLRGYWTRKRPDITYLLRDALREYDSLSGKSKAFDEELMADLTRIGGEEYAQIAALAYRQAIAAHKLVVDVDGRPKFLPKENSSGGYIGTVDVFYPSAPLFLFLNPKLLEASVEPVLQYAAMGRWPFPFAPHDLGRYPLANGQLYGDGERSENGQMPVEESGNMLLLTAAIIKAEGDPALARKYWPILTKWAEYLSAKGFDPENQLCTDDFSGYLAHNANLSLKAILALAAYGKMCVDRSAADKYRRLATEFADRWMKAADDGDHYRLALDKPGTWSQKYNLVWNRLLDLNVFPPEVARKEVAFYKTKQNAYGLPLDNRREWTKLDWLLWSATLAENQSDFHAFIGPVYKSLNVTSSRAPLTDFFWTHNAESVRLHARSVVGGVFIKALTDPVIWNKWLKRAGFNAGLR